MAKFHLSEKASYDLDDIADYTFETFGERQAGKYSNELLDIFALLAQRPHMGRAANDLAKGLRSYPFQAHIIYYKTEGNDLFVVRVLHHSMDAKRHL